jgi:hypothetical protein
MSAAGRDRSSRTVRAASPPGWMPVCTGITGLYSSADPDEAALDTRLLARAIALFNTSYLLTTRRVHPGAQMLPDRD